MADRNLELALVVKAQIAQARKALGDLETELRGTGNAAKSAGAGAAKAGEGIDQAGRNANKAAARATKLRQSMARLTPITQKTNKAFHDLRNVLVAAFVVHELAGFTSELVHTNIEAQRIHFTMQQAFGSGAAKQMQFVSNLAQQLGQRFSDAAEGYAQLAVSAKGTGLKTADLQSFFKGISEAATVLHAAPQDISGVFQQLAQGISLGKLQMQDIRAISQHLPGTMNVMKAAAQSLGLSLQQMLQTGGIPAVKIIGALGKQLQIAYAAESKLASHSLLAELNRLHNTLFNLQTDGSGFEKNFAQAVEKLNAALNDPLTQASIRNMIQEFGEFLAASARNLPKIIDGLRTFGPLALKIGAAFVGWKVLGGLARPAVGLFNVFRKYRSIPRILVGVRAAFTALKLAMGGIPAILTAIGLGAAGLYEVYKQVQAYTHVASNANQIRKEGKKTIDDLRKAYIALKKAQGDEIPVAIKNAQQSKISTQVAARGTEVMLLQAKAILARKKAEAQAARNVPTLTSGANLIAVQKKQHIDSAIAAQEANINALLFNLKGEQQLANQYRTEIAKKTTEGHLNNAINFANNLLHPPKSNATGADNAAKQKAAQAQKAAASAAQQLRQAFIGVQAAADPVAKIQADYNAQLDKYAQLEAKALKGTHANTAAIKGYYAGLKQAANAARNASLAALADKDRKAWEQLKQSLRTPAEVNVDGAIKKLQQLNALFNRGKSGMTHEQYLDAAQKIGQQSVKGQPKYRGITNNIGFLGNIGSQLADNFNAQKKNDAWYQARKFAASKFHATSEAAEAEHTAHMATIDKKYSAEKKRIESARGTLTLQTASGIFGQLATLSSSHNRKMAEIGKAAAIAQAIIKTYQSANSAYAAMAGIPYIGPELGAAAAAVAIAAGLANVAQIRQQQVGQYAGGGAIRGPGTPTSDSVPILASRGEYMQRAAAVNYYGVDFMDALNGLHVPRFAGGGVISGPADFANVAAPQVSMPRLPSMRPPQAATGASSQAATETHIHVWSVEEAAQKMAALPSMQKAIVHIVGDHPRTIKAKWGG